MATLHPADAHLLAAAMPAMPAPIAISLILHAALMPKFVTSSHPCNQEWVSPLSACTDRHNLRRDYGSGHHGGDDHGEKVALNLENGEPDQNREVKHDGQDRDPDVGLDLRPKVADNAPLMRSG